MGKADMDAIRERIAEGEKIEKERKRAHMKKQAKERTTSFFQDFKKFITKGNVIDLAVAVVIGSAFNAIVNGLVKFIINPLIALIPGLDSLDNLKTVLTEEVVEDGVVTTPEVAILWGEWIQTILQFLIIAFCIFLVLRVITRMHEAANREEIEAKAAAEAKAKAEADAEAAAKAQAAAEEEARREAALAQFYANVERQTALLEQIAQQKK